MLTAEDWTALGVSLRVAGLGAGLALAAAIPCALILARGRFPGRTLLDGLVNAPLVIPPVASGFLLLTILGPRTPLGAGFESVFGVRLAFSWVGAGLASAIGAFPFAVRALKLGFERTPESLDQVAAELGAGAWDRFWSLTWPLAAPGALAAALMAFAVALGEFGAVITFAANIPGETQTLPLAIYTAIQSPGGDARALRLCALSIGVAVLAAVFAQAVRAASMRR
ncbi:MAG: ABC transporter permease subunit [Maricaulaceae bacterium]